MHDVARNVSFFRKFNSSDGVTFETSTDKRDIGSEYAESDLDSVQSKSVFA